jgi:glutathione S-transferase
MTTSAVPGVQAFHTFPPAPAALIVDIFLREKGITEDAIKSVEKFVDLPAFENRGEACKKMNPQGSIPWFVTTEGIVVAETIAMCEYIEDVMPEPPLVGSSAAERGTTRMWQRRLEEHFCSPATYAHRNWCHSDDCPSDNGMKNFYTKRFNAEQGSNLLYSQPAAWKDLAAWALNRVAWLEQTKQEEARSSGKPSPSDFICGDRLTMVDIQMYVNMFYWDTFNPGQYFFKNLEGQIPWLDAWYKRMHTRPTIAAARSYAGYKDRSDKADIDAAAAA